MDHDEAGGAPCPVCGRAEIVDTVRRERLPVMKNYVYSTQEAALAAPHERLVVAVCRYCGFAWNRGFDPARLAYDAGYDNTVPSAVMDVHYRGTAARCSTARLQAPLLVVLNENYRDEIERTCQELGVEPALVSLGEI